MSFRPIPLKVASSFKEAERAGDGLTSVWFQSQAGLKHSVPQWPPSPLLGGLCSQFHAIRAAACFPAKACQGYKEPWVGSHQEGWAWKIGKMYHKAHPLDGCRAPCSGVSRPSSVPLPPLPISLPTEFHLPLSFQRTSTSFRWNGANKLKGGAPNESKFFCMCFFFLYALWWILSSHIGAKLLTSINQRM